MSLKERLSKINIDYQDLLGKILASEGIKDNNEDVMVAIDYFDLEEDEISYVIFKNKGCDEWGIVAYDRKPLSEIINFEMEKN